jgi:hypothetical protein
MLLYLAPMLLLCIPLHPMFLLPVLQLFMSCPLCSYSIVLAFDPAPFAPNSVRLFLLLLLPMCTALYSLTSYVPASNASTLYALLPLLPLRTSLLLIQLPFLLIQCSCSLCLCSLWLLLRITLHPMFLLPMLPSTLAFFLPPIFSFLFATGPYAFDP